MPFVSQILVLITLSALISCGRGAPRFESKHTADTTQEGDAQGNVIGKSDPEPEGGSTDGHEFQKVVEDRQDLSLTWSDAGNTAPTKDPALSNTQHRYFTISVKDKASKAPIAGASFKTMNKITVVSDKNGKIAFYEPGLMNMKIYFKISHPGWKMPADGFGNSGVALMTAEGGSQDVLLTKTTGTTVASTDVQSRLLKNGQVPTPARLFGIRVIDKETGRAIPLIFVKTSSGDSFITDSQGLVAYYNIDNMDRQTTFAFSGDGYKDSTASLVTKAGTISTVAIERLNIAERLYRSTGAGIYRDSYMLGLKTPGAHPLLNGLVMGQDTFDAVIYKDKIFWIWQDTDSPLYPLGNYSNASATSLLPGQGGLSQDIGTDSTYFVDNNGFAKKMAPGYAPSSLPTWMGSLVAVPDANNEERLYSRYDKAASDGDFVGSGWALFDDKEQIFKPITDFPQGPFAQLNGAPMPFAHQGQRYIYYGLLRVPAQAEKLVDINAYEMFSPYQPGTQTPVKDAEGNLLYAWQHSSYTGESDNLSKQGFSPRQILTNGKDFQDLAGQPLSHASNKVAASWNDFRKRFSGIIQQRSGTPSLLGEIWYAEADTPMGPWNFAEKIITHKRYTFYNVKQKSFYNQLNGRMIYIEGTYTATYSGASQTPRYDYNQVRYRLDLKRESMILPVPVYDTTAVSGLPDLMTKEGVKEGFPPLSARFFAMDRYKEGLVGYGWSGPSCQPRRKLIPTAANAIAALFYGRPLEAEDSPATETLYEFQNDKGEFSYATTTELAGFSKRIGPLAKVWKSSSWVKVPVADYLGSLTADAGSDQCLILDKGAKTLTVSLDARGSLTRGSAITGYHWRVEGVQYAKNLDGRSVQLNLPPGIYHAELIVTDADNNDSRDTSIIEIQ